jgi:hypothetical protein
MMFLLILYWTFSNNLLNRESMPRQETRKKKMAHSAQTYETQEAFVQAKVDQANELLLRIDPNEFQKIFGQKK